MWIKMDANLGSDWPHPWKNGEVHHCHADLGQKLVSLNLAVEVDPPIKPEPAKEPKSKKRDVIKDQDAELQRMIEAEEKAKAPESFRVVPEPDRKSLTPGTPTK